MLPRFHSRAKGGKLHHLPGKHETHTEWVLFHSIVPPSWVNTGLSTEASPRNSSLCPLEKQSRHTPSVFPGAWFVEPSASAAGAVCLGRPWAPSGAASRCPGLLFGLECLAGPFFLSWFFIVICKGRKRVDPLKTTQLLFSRLQKISQPRSEIPTPGAPSFKQTGRPWRRLEGPCREGVGGAGPEESEEEASFLPKATSQQHHSAPSRNASAGLAPRRTMTWRDAPAPTGPRPGPTWDPRARAPARPPARAEATHTPRAL